MGETAPARKRSVDVTCQTGTPTENQIRWTGGARGGGATNPNQTPINPNVRVCPIQKADEFSTPRQHRSTHPEVVGGRNT